MDFLSPNGHTTSVPPILRRTPDRLRATPGGLSHSGAIGAIRREAHWTTYYKLIERASVPVTELSQRLLQLVLRVLMAVRNRGNLARKSAGQHGCKRGTAALTAMLQRTRPSAASRDAPGWRPPLTQCSQRIRTKSYTVLVRI